MLTFVFAQICDYHHLSPAGHRFNSPKSINKIAILGGLRDVSADSDIKCHITPVLSNYSPLVAVLEAGPRSAIGRTPDS